MTIPSDGEVILNTATFKFIVTALENSTGVVFKVSASLTFDNTEERVRIDALSQEYSVVLPTISAQTDVSAK